MPNDFENFESSEKSVSQPAETPAVELESFNSADLNQLKSGGQELKAESVNQLEVPFSGTDMWRGDKSEKMVAQNYFSGSFGGANSDIRAALTGLKRN